MLNRRLNHLGIFVLSLSAVAISGPSLAGEKDSELRIAHGEEVAECGFAPVVSVDVCTALLVHPKLVLYAAHCGRRSKVHFTHRSRAGFSVRTEFCKTHPSYSGRQRHDVAFCVLKEEVKDIPIVPVAFGCELEGLGKGTGIVQCGFGSNYGKSSGSGIKRWGKNTVARLRDQGNGGTVTTSPSKIVGCPGDSGGPLLTRLKDGTWRTLGMASTIDTGYDSCGRPGAVNTYAYAKAAVQWVEKESKIDITPCFDGDGTWNPTEACGGFYMGDEKGQGTWKNRCEGTPKSGYSSTCGDPFGGSNEAPTVSILTPNKDLEIQKGKALKVEVEAKDDSKVVRVELYVDKKKVDSDDESPYAFVLEGLALGEHELRARAIDDAEEEAESAVISISVVEGTVSEEDSDPGEDSGDGKDNPDEDEDSDDEGDNEVEEQKTEASSLMIGADAGEREDRWACSLQNGGARSSFGYFALFLFGASAWRRRKQPNRR